MQYRIPEEEREKGAENIFEDIRAENFPNLGKETDIYVQEAQRVPYRINPKGITPSTKQKDSLLNGRRYLQMVCQIRG